jgi:hypothetical protein
VNGTHQWRATERGMEPMSDAPPPQYQPPEGSYPGWPPSPPPPAPGYPPYAAPYPYHAPYPPYAPSRGGNTGWIVAGVVLIVVVVVGSCFGATYAFSQIMRAAISSISNSTSAQAHTTQQFTVSDTPNIQIDIAVGTVVIVSGAPGMVSVDATVTAGGNSTAAAQRNLNAMGFSATQSDNTIAIQTTQTVSSSPFSRPEADLVITAPAAANVSAQLTTGNLELIRVTGSITATIEEGNFNAQGLTLQGNSRVEVSYGTVVLDGGLAPGATANVSVESGEVTVSLPAAPSTHLVATADSGSISISGWNVAVQPQGDGATAEGDLGTGGAGSLTIHVTSGGIVLVSR